MPPDNIPTGIHQIFIRFVAFFSSAYLSLEFICTKFELMEQEYHCSKLKKEAGREDRYKAREVGEGR